MNSVSLLAWVLLGAVMSAFGGILLKIGATRMREIHGLADAVLAVTDWRIVLGLMMYVVPTFIWIGLLRKVELSLLQPLLAIVYVITPALAYLFLKESISPLRAAGIGVIIVGVIIVSRS